MTLGVDLVVLACVVVGVALTGLLVALVLRVLRESDLSRAVASVFATPATPFALRFTTSSPRLHRVWLRFELDHGGARYDYGVTAQMQLQVGSGPPSSIEMRVGATAPVLGPNSMRCRSLTRASHYAESGGRAAVGAMAQITSLPPMPPGTAVAITGTVVVADGSEAKRLLVFVVPA